MTSDTLASALQRRVDNAQVLVTLGPGIAAAADMVSEALRNGHQVLLFGNGGSAADAQHIAAELVGRFVRERRGFPAAALTTDSSILTAVANDYGFEQIFARQVSATGGPGDVAIGISTSGRSENVLAGVQAAIDAGMRTIGLSGRDGGALATLAELCIVVPQSETSLIQECHAAIGHILCELVDEALLPSDGAT
jgi:phosphoheptose isomerase